MSQLGSGTLEELDRLRSKQMDDFRRVRAAEHKAKHWKGNHRNVVEENIRLRDELAKALEDVAAMRHRAVWITEHNPGVKLPVIGEDVPTVTSDGIGRLQFPHQAEEMHTKHFGHSFRLALNNPSRAAIEKTKGKFREEMNTKCFDPSFELAIKNPCRKCGRNLGNTDHTSCPSGECLGDEFNPGLQYRKTLPIRAKQVQTQRDLDEAKSRVSEECLKYVKIDSWLITGHRGCNYVIANDIFREMYELVPAEDEGGEIPSHICIGKELDGSGVCEVCGCTLYGRVTPMCEHQGCHLTSTRRNMKDGKHRCEWHAGVNVGRKLVQARLDRVIDVLNRLVFFGDNLEAARATLKRHDRQW